VSGVAYCRILSCPRLIVVKPIRVADAANSCRSERTLAQEEQSESGGRRRHCPRESAARAVAYGDEGGLLVVVIAVRLLGELAGERRAIYLATDRSGELADDAEAFVGPTVA
jgi:hypothetical protein